MHTKDDPALRSPETREAIREQQAARAAIRSACTRSPGCLSQNVSLDALAAKYTQVAAMRSAVKLLLSTLQGRTAAELREKVGDIHERSFDTACEALWDILSDEPTAVYTPLPDVAEVRAVNNDVADRLMNEFEKRANLVPELIETYDWMRTLAGALRKVVA